MATFEDNTAVTAEDLNNIAIDLGDTTFSAFDSEKFGVDKLNEITSDLVSKGILTADNKCEPILNDGKIYIKSGVIVFASGAKIKIESPAEIAAVAGDYIYAYNNVNTGKAGIIANAEMPTSGDYVMLAQLDNTGAVVDLREMSVANLTLSAELQNNYAEQTVEFNTTSGSEIVVAPEFSQCRYLILTSSSWGEANLLHFMMWHSPKLTEEYQLVFNSTTSDAPTLYVKKVGGLLYFSCRINNSSGRFYGNIKFVLV